MTSMASDHHVPSADRLNSLTSATGRLSDGSGTRRTSFNFLRRQKSNEPHPRPKMSKKERARQEELLRQQQREAHYQRSPPRLPTHAPLPQLNSFGGEDARPDSIAIVSNKAGRYQQQNPNAYRAMSQSPQPHAMPTRAAPPPGTASSSPGTRNGEYDPYARTESMTHRGRYSYASSAVSANAINSPRRVRRRRDPTPFNILVIGAKSSGKTSFIEFLRTALVAPSKGRAQTPSPPRTALPPDSPFSCQYLETEMDHERIGVTLWDSEGLEKGIVDLQLPGISSFLESKFEDTFAEEQKVIRAPGVRDTHIHCVFLILDPTRLDANIAAARQTGSNAIKYGLQPQKIVGGLDEDFDLNVLRTLQGKTTVIPVISKADTITTAHMNHLKRTVWDSLKQARLDPLESLNLGDSDSDEYDGFDEREEDEYQNSSDESDGEDKAAHADPNLSSDTPATSAAPSSSPLAPSREAPSKPTDNGNGTLASDEPPFLPMSIISPDTYEPGAVGRRFPWGFADPYNSEHCDFVRLKESVFSEWRGELREASRERWYEGWRTSRLKRRGESRGASVLGAPSRGGGTPARSTISSEYLSPPNGAKGMPVGMAISTPRRSEGGDSARMPRHIGQY